MKIITRNILVLSLVSLFNDVASEMLYPVMPIYLESIGFSVVLIGILEGAAEAVSGLSKGYFGSLSDNKARRLPFVQLGYGISAIAKPLMTVWAFPLWVFVARSMDRLGKGIRTGARDALLSDEATPETKGRVFGFHRTMDTTGAFLGPLLALLFLAYFPNNYRALFLISFFPGVITIVFTFLIKEKVKQTKRVKPRTHLADFIHYWKASPAAYRKLVIGLLIFTLFNSSDVFLLLKIKEAGFSDKMVIGMYVFYNFIYAVCSYPFGALADKLGMKKILALGFLLFACTYLTIPFVTDVKGCVVIFVLYGAYAAATEGIAKAWITNICKRENTATAIGTFTAFQSIAALLASSIAGLLWSLFGSSATFFLTGIVTFIVTLYIVSLKE